MHSGAGLGTELASGVGCWLAQSGTENQNPDFPIFSYALEPQTCTAILNKADEGILSLCGPDGQPYGVPLNFVFKNNQIIFHFAPQGRKLDLIAQNPRACFTVIDQKTVLPEQYSTAYSSVMAFGSCQLLTDRQEKKAALECLVNKYCAQNTQEDIRKTIDKGLDRTTMVAMDVEEISGKHSIYLDIR